MADVSITSANVKAASESVRTIQGTLGETLVAGDLVYLKSSDSRYWKTDSDAADTAVAAGVVLIGGSAADIGTIVTHGAVTFGAVLTAGVVYVLSSNAAKMCAITDGNHASGDFITIVGVASTTSVMTIRPYVSGVAKP